ncbi:MAG: sugar phosphate isomerase/epimerase family protein [Lacipirellulaceae bacterium]
MFDDPQFSRRGVLATGAAALAGFALPTQAQESVAVSQSADEPLFKISLAEWSLHNAFGRDGKDNLRFPWIAKKLCGIDAIEYVTAFFKNQAEDKKYLTELKVRCDDLGVKSLLIMVDGEGHLGDPNEAKRAKAVDNHKKWVEAAKFLGCHSIRVNAHSSGSRQEQMKLAADGLRSLTEWAAPHEINVIVENHGGLSSDGDWLSGVMKLVDLPGCGTLPDFGNFRIQGDQWYDRYKGVTQLMPFAKAVSAKSHEFDAEGNETKSDYYKLMKIVLDAGYRGYVGIEWEGGKPSEIEGIMLTKHLLEKVREKLSA